MESKNEVCGFIVLKGETIKFWLKDEFYIYVSPVNRPFFQLNIEIKFKKYSTVFTNVKNLIIGTSTYIDNLKEFSVSTSLDFTDNTYTDLEKITLCLFNSHMILEPCITGFAVPNILPTTLPVYVFKARTKLKWTQNLKTVIL